MTLRVLLAAITVAGILACDRAPMGGAAGSDYAALSIGQKGNAAMTVAGLSRADLRVIQVASLDAAGWQKLLRVSVAGVSDSVAIAGRYAVRDNELEFRPMFPFDADREYRVHFDATAPPLRRASGSWTSTFRLAAANVSAEPTRILRILPSGDEWPENQLRIYVEFSAPMSRSSGLSHAKLLDEKGNEVKEAFLPIEADFWNHDATRYTFFFDPGRVKRGILPNEELGPPLLRGKTYTLVIDSLWRDAHGRMLAASYRRGIRVSPPVQERVSMDSWSIRLPGVGTAEPVRLEFPRQLDHGLLLRALGVETSNGVAVAGEGAVIKGEMGWQFTPRHTWRPGEYRVVVLSILEDGAGNRIDRAFEVDKFAQVDSSATMERYYVKFVVR